MALDGAFLHHIRKEILQNAQDSRVDKIYQPNKNEIVMTLRSKESSYKLLFSIRANSARVNFTNIKPENPKTPPMLCMLLRKRLCSSRLVDIRQPELERALLFDFDSVNELGDHVKLCLAMEIMGRYSNLIFIDENCKIIDALKRVDAEMSSERLVLPGVTYQLPPSQNKLSLLTADAEEIINKIENLPAEMLFNKALLKTVQGVSPIVCREIQHIISYGNEFTNRNISNNLRERAVFFIKKLIETVRNTSGEPYMAVVNKKPFDFSFINITQYGIKAVLYKKESFSALLDDFYGERDAQERMRAKSQDLIKILANISDRLSRKIIAQNTDLQNCSQREELKLCGDLLSANLYQIPKGVSEIILQNFYDENLKNKKIKLNPALSANQNAQKYYKKYKKETTAEHILTEQIEKAEKENSYIDTVVDELSRAANENDLEEIREELREQGYLRRQKGKQKPPKIAAPMEFRTSDGYKVLVGRNNRQNDKLTLKTASKTDLWFHTQKIAGSHTILVLNGENPSEKSIIESANIAAYFSHAKDSSQVPVDYTYVKYINKPVGSKPGMVIFRHQQTLYITPQKELIDKLKQ